MKPAAGSAGRHRRRQRVELLGAVRRLVPVLYRVQMSAAFRKLIQATTLCDFARRAAADHASLGARRLATLWAHLVEMPPPVTALRSELAPAVDSVIARAMAKAPEERYGSCRELIAELDAALEVAAPVRGGRGVSGGATAPPLGATDLEHEQQTRPPSRQPSFPPGSFPPGAAPSGVQLPAEPPPDSGPFAADAQDYINGEEPDDGEDEPHDDKATPPAQAGFAPEPPGTRPRRHRRLIIAAIVAVAIVAAGAVAAVMLWPGKALRPQLSRTYTSGPQFYGIVHPFTVHTPADWVAASDGGVDVTLSPVANAINGLFAARGQNGSWNSVRDLLKGSRAEVTGLWIHAQATTFFNANVISEKSLQDAVRTSLPTMVEFDLILLPGPRVENAASWELTGRFEDLADPAGELQFVLDVVQWDTAVGGSALFVFLAAPDQFDTQRPVFDRVRDSFAFG
jgi:hypothetical protein